MAIENEGLGPDTRVTVDDRITAVPIRLPKGSDLRRIVLFVSGQPERTIDLDGTTNRTIELIRTSLNRQTLRLVTMRRRALRRKALGETRVSPDP